MVPWPPAPSTRDRVKAAARATGWSSGTAGVEPTKEPGLHQLRKRVRAEIRRVGLPVDGLPNAPPFMDEDLSDNAFAYASLQVLKVGEREDGWHTDGGASLLHAGLTIFGSRQLLVKVKGEKGCISLAQRPGSFYVGNLCALEHNVAHGASAQGSYGPPENKVQITVMLRSDLFRQVRARKKDACPGPQSCSAS